MQTKDTICKLWQWEPFEYLCEGFTGELDSVRGVFPADVRHKCDFTIKRIHGPVVRGPMSFIMHVVIN